MTDGTNTAHAPELLPCPFCGNSRITVCIVEHIDGGIDGVQINCADCDAYQIALNEKQAIAAWNRRAPTLLSHVEVLRKALEWAMTEIDRVSNSKCGFAYPQGIVHQYPHSETEQRVTSTKYHEAITALDQTKATQ